MLNEIHQNSITNINSVSLCNGNTISNIIGKDILPLHDDDFINSKKNEDAHKINSSNTNNGIVINEDDPESKQKDKFTYQKLISEKLKIYTANGNLDSQINDSVLLKSLISLCNKNYKNYDGHQINSNKQFTKFEQEFIQSLKNNISLLDEYQNNLNIKHFYTKKLRLSKKSFIYKKRISKVIKYTKQMFGSLKYKKYDRVLLRQILELFVRYKEDDMTSIYDKVKELVIDPKIDKDELRTLRFYIKIYFQIINLNERKLYVNDEKLWKILNDICKNINLVPTIKQKGRKKNILQNPDSLDSINISSSKKVRRKQLHDVDSLQKNEDKNESKIKKNLENEGKSIPATRNIFLVFKDVGINEENKSVESNPIKDTEIKKKGKRPKKIKEETENKEQISDNLAIMINCDESKTDQLIDVKSESKKEILNTEDKPKVVKQRKLKKVKEEKNQDSQIVKVDEENNPEIVFPKPKKPRKKKINKDTNLDKDIIITETESPENINKKNDIIIENIPIIPEKIVKKKGRHKKIIPENTEENVAVLNNKDQSNIANPSVSNTNLTQNDNPVQVKKRRKSNKVNQTNSNLGSSFINPNLNVPLQQQNFFNNSLIEQIQMSNQINNSNNIINNNINNSINISNSFNNPEIKNINIVYNADINNKIHLPNLFPNNNLGIFNFNFIKNISNNVNSTNVPNFESFFESNGECKYIFYVAHQQINNDSHKLENEKIPYFNIPVIIPVNNLMIPNSPTIYNHNYNNIFYENFYQKIIDYNKAVAEKITNEEIPTISQNTNGIYQSKY